MNFLLWIIQSLLSAFFLFHGRLYIFWPAAMVARRQQQKPAAKPLGLAPGFRRFIGVAEWLAAAGLILPGITGVLTWLVSVAAVSLMIVTICAIGFHLSRHETSELIMPGIMFLLATFVAYMRWFVLPL